MTQVKLTFHSIDECGYFERGAEHPAFGDSQMLLNEFRQWAKDGAKTFSETCTYEPSETSHLLRTFCYDCLHNGTNGDHLLITWNESPSFNGEIAHIPENGMVGGGGVSSVNLPQGAIPGFPAYFYFVPSENAYATVRFDSVLNGNVGLQKLLREFLGKFTSHCVPSEDAAADGEIVLLGYRADENDMTRRLSARFSTSLLRQPAMLEYIQGSREQIRKIHRKNLLLPTGPAAGEDPSMGLFARLFRGFGSAPQNNREEIHVSYEMEVTPTERELNSIIRNWRQTVTDDRTGWEDVGFQMHGDQSVRWLSSELIRLEPNLRVAVNDLGIASASELFAELQRIRTTILQTIRLRNG